MHSETPNVVRVRLKSGNLFVRVIVEDAYLEVVGASHEPVLARNEANTSYGDFRDFKGFHQCPSFMIVNVDGAVVETCEQPWLGRVEVDTLDAIRASEQFPLQCKLVAVHHTHYLDVH